MSRRPRYDAVLARVAAGTGVHDVLALQEQVEALAEAVAENAALEVGLVDRVGSLERSLVAVIEHHGRQAQAALEELRAAEQAGADGSLDATAEGPHGSV